MIRNNTPMKKAVVNELISTMREVTLKEGNLANILMDILCKSKEAIYRRLWEGFTFSEVAIIAGQLGISLDKIIGNSMSSGAMFDLNVLNLADPMDTYCEILVRYQRLFRYVKTDPTTEVVTASNTIPLYILRPLRTFVKVPDWQVVISERTLENSHVLVRYRSSGKLVKIQKELIEDLRLVRRLVLS